MAGFPDGAVVGRVLDRFHLPEGRRPGAPYRRAGMHTHAVRPLLRDLTVLAAYVEVTLARRGHTGPIGVNLLTKVRAPTLPTLYGAMLAGVDCGLMGAGIPREIPGALDAFAGGREAVMRLQDGHPAGEPEPTLRFDPAQVPYGAAELPRPAFLAIVSAASLAAMLVQRSNGRVDGVRGRGPIDRRAQRAAPRSARPGCERPARVRAARPRRRGTDEGIGAAVLARRPHRLRGGPRRGPGRRRQRNPGGHPLRLFPRVRYGTRASPAGDRGGAPGCRRGAHRCPQLVHLAEGGTLADTVERRCLCNGLLATAGFARVQKDGTVEPPVVTSGDDLVRLPGLLPHGRGDYGAADVIRYLEGKASSL